ncbi:MAG: SRPBCC domain-containing protein [Deltaproteobacteria bacterium]|nr:SRPBCC domain-containing protein [Deltaproteobacteria bacterium]
MSAKKIVFEQSYTATLDEVWELWTTADGIEAWWGPEGFSTKIKKLEVKSGGAIHYAMTAVAPEMVQFMKQAGMPTTTETKGHFSEVTPKTRLVLVQVMDFVPGVAPYDIASVLELSTKGKTVKMKVTVDAAHNEEWTTRSKMGWESQLGRLSKLLKARAAKRKGSERRAD